MNERQSSELSEIFETVSCQWDHRCANGESGDNRRVRDLGLENYVDCLSECPRGCSYVMSFGNGCLCTCPARVYLTKQGN